MSTFQKVSVSFLGHSTLYVKVHLGKILRPKLLPMAVPSLCECVSVPNEQDCTLYRGHLPLVCEWVNADGTCINTVYLPSILIFLVPLKAKWQINEQDYFMAIQDLQNLNQYNKAPRMGV